MRIGIIGTGRLGQTTARIWAAKDHEIILASRDEARAQKIAAGISGTVSGAHFSSLPDSCDAVLFAFPWYALTDIARGVGPLENIVLIDCINPITSSGSLALGHKNSAAEEIAKIFPRARVIKAFNHLYYDHFNHPVFGSTPADAFYCSDHDDAKTIVAQLAKDAGFNPVDLGPLKFARYLEPLALLWIQEAFLMGRGPDFTIKFISRGE
ncbi:MAG: NADPH-dependent F420 reductase [Ardenticatenaceae bacterium]|nr:NADPH-dependent F420 reductase [Ardenticatenaceae bacterium]